MNETHILNWRGCSRASVITPGVLGSWIYSSWRLGTSVDRERAAVRVVLIPIRRSNRKDLAGLDNLRRGVASFSAFSFYSFNDPPSLLGSSRLSSGEKVLVRWGSWCAWSAVHHRAVRRARCIRCARPDVRCCLCVSLAGVQVRSEFLDSCEDKAVGFPLMDAHASPSQALKRVQIRRS